MYSTPFSFPIKKETKSHISKGAKLSKTFSKQNMFKTTRTYKIGHFLFGRQKRSKHKNIF